MNNLKNLVIILFIVTSPLYLYSQDWFTYASKMMESYQKGEIAKATGYGEYALKQAEIEFGKRDSMYMITELILGNFYVEMTNYDKAEMLLLDARQTSKEIFGVKHQYYATSLNNLAELYNQSGNYEKAKPLYLECIEIDKGIFGERHPSYGKDLSNIASLYVKLSDFEKAQKLYIESLDIAKESLGEKSRDYSTVANNLAALYQEIGQYSKAEELYLKALEIRREILDKKDPLTANTLVSIASLYSDLGQYQKAEPLCIEARGIYRNAYGEKHPSYALSLMNLAAIYNSMKSYNLSEPLYLEAKEIYRTKLGAKHPSYANLLINLASLYYDIKQYGKAETLTLEANKIYKEIAGEKRLEYSTTVNNLAAIYRKMGNYPLAEKYNLEALQLREKNLGTKHPYYAISLSSISVLYNETKNFDKAEKYFLEANSNYLNQITSYFPSMSEKEKLTFIKGIDESFEQFYSFAVNRYNKNNSISAEICNLRLSTKGMILSSSIQIRNRIMNSNDAQLVELYEKLIRLQNDISHIYTLSIEEQKKKDINLSELESSANNIEKELGSKSEIFKSEIEQRRITFDDVKESLSHDEAAVEFFNFRFYDKVFTDSVYYYALIIRKNFKFPVLVKLCNEIELQKRLSQPAEKEDSYVKNYSVNLSVYDLIWKPLESFLADCRIVNISPSGLLNRVSFSSLYVDREKLLCDKYSINYLSNLKENIIKKQNIKTVKDISIFSAAIFGSPDFDVEMSTPKNISSDFTRGQGEEWSPPAGMILQDIPSIKLSKWHQLSGALIEADKVKLIFENQKLKANEYTGENASEEAVKSLNYKNSPTVLHLATHGYFFPEPRKEYKELGASPFKTSENPLFRSGLILSGANRVWMGGNEIEGVENGILTAYEVANMDLMNTELVVLSACETGLGDIMGGEGVYGLQRAFKVAGAKTIIMSLWKVPDKETVELMELFYTNWLSGMTKYEAFNNAQKEMRKKYPPYYWAAFVMVE